MNNILVVAVHPDDETLGCGGTLLKHKYNGDKIHWLICTSINNSNQYFQQRSKEIEKVAQLYSFNSVTQLDLNTMQIDEYSMSELISKISPVFNTIKPNTIYLPFHKDVHSDHRKIFEAAYSCSKSFRYPFIKRILMMETLSETEFAPSLIENSFNPNSFVDITDFIDKKIEIIKIFESEIAKHPFPRSIINIKALATLRGATCNTKYAESFILLKDIN